MTAGQEFTNDDNFTGTVTIDNIVRHLITAKKTWKSYAEGLLYVGYTGGNTGNYLQRHNPLSFFSDVVNDNIQVRNLVPFTQFTIDLTNNQLPDFSFIAPDIIDDAHNGTLAQADAWLKQNIAPLISSPAFQQNGLLLIVFDEAEFADKTIGVVHDGLVWDGSILETV